MKKTGVFLLAVAPFTAKQVSLSLLAEPSGGPNTGEAVLFDQSFESWRPLGI